MINSIVHRVTDPMEVNVIINDPAVRPWVANGNEPLDVTPQLSDDRNVFLFGEHGGVGFLQVMPGIYEAHTQVLPAGRGEWTKKLTEACVRFMFTRTEAYEIVTRVPSGHVAAKAAAEAQGMKLEFTRSNNVMFRNRVVDCHILSFRIQDWIARTPELASTGAWLHHRMESEATRLGIAVDTHEPDENHNLYVGAAIEMMFGGQYVKAVTFYNRWVSIARHMRDGALQHVQLVSTDPPTVRFDIGLMRFHADDIEVIREC